MKNEIAYFYHLYPEKIIKRKERYVFENQGKNYVLYPYNRSLHEIEAIFALNQALARQNAFFPRLILNGMQQALTFLNGKYYILKEDILPSQNIHFQEVSYQMNYTFPQNQLKSIQRNNWAALWESKIDYFEYQREHIYQKFPILTSGLDYFIGLAENAIAYVKTVEKNVLKTGNDTLTFARRRVHVNDTLSDFYDPLNLVIDYKVRDIAEYIKSCFFDSDITGEVLENWLLQLQLSPYSWGLLMGRLLFPSYYFDLYEQIVNGKENEERILNVLEKIDEFREFLGNLQEKIRKDIKIPMVEWLQTKKEML